MAIVTAITIWRAIEKSPILLLQYWNNEQFMQQKLFYLPESFNTNISH